MYWLVIIIGTLLLSISISNPFYRLIFKNIFELNAFLQIIFRIFLFIIGFITIFIGLYIESI